jgi:hypothetical protein
MNGAIATIGNNIIYNRLIPWQTARPILVACRNRGMEMASEINGTHYANFDVAKRWPSLMAEYENVDFNNHEKNAEKIYTPNPTAEDRAFIESMLPEDLYFVITADGEDSTLGQIMHKDATKGKAIAALAKFWGIPPKLIAAFGDDYNDIDMLRDCGAGIAMGNAVKAVKDTAKYICDTNDNDGVAKWLEGHVLLRYAQSSTTLPDSPDRAQAKASSNSV